MKIIVLENKIHLLERFKKSLTSHGYDPYFVETIEGAVQVLEKIPNDFALIIIDLDETITKKNISGFCKQIREMGSDAPILFFSDEVDITMRIEMLECGATDYIVRPFSIANLVEKIRNMLKIEPEAVAQVNKLKFSNKDRSVEIAGKKVALTKKESSILLFLMSHPEEILSRETIFENVWTLESSFGSNVVDVHIKNIRKKISGGQSFTFIDTIWGEGYKYYEK